MHGLQLATLRKPTIALDQMSCAAPMTASAEHRAAGIILGTALVYSPQCLLLCKHRAVGLILGTVLVVQHL